jgi:hypothetical protein
MQKVEVTKAQLCQQLGISLDWLNKLIRWTQEDLNREIGKKEKGKAKYFTQAEIKLIKFKQQYLQEHRYDRRRAEITKH